MNERYHLPDRLNKYTESNVATWSRMVKFSYSTISKIQTIICTAIVGKFCEKKSGIWLWQICKIGKVLEPVAVLRVDCGEIWTELLWHLNYFVWFLLQAYNLRESGQKRSIVTCPQIESKDIYNTCYPIILITLWHKWAFSHPWFVLGICWDDATQTPVIMTTNRILYYVTFHKCVYTWFYIKWYRIMNIIRWGQL